MHNAYQPDRTIQHTDSFRTRHLAHLFSNMLEKLPSLDIGVVCTAEGLSSLHPTVANGHLFTKKVVIAVPDKDARAEVSP